jgi:hypothetical protein
MEDDNTVISIQVLREVTNSFRKKKKTYWGREFSSLYVYKGELANRTKVAVKRMQFEMVGNKGLNEFKFEIAVLTKV